MDRQNKLPLVLLLLMLLLLMLPLVLLLSGAANPAARVLLHNWQG